ncbi:MAG: hypothetical protein Q9186_006009 [Xanthomendoza sp. 1 TL-2023]
MDHPPLDKPGFDLYADQRGRMVGSLVSFIVLTTIFVVLRLLSRKLARAGFWYSGMITFLSLLGSSPPSAVLCGFSVGLVHPREGHGRHIYIWGPVEGSQKFRRWRIILYAFELDFHTSTTLAKYSMSVPPSLSPKPVDGWLADMLAWHSLAFYYRIFPVPSFRRLLVWTTILCTLYMIAIDLTIIFQCQPIHHQWDQVVGTSKGHCIQEYWFFVGSGSANVVLNILVFVLPMPLLWRLRTTARQQIVLTVIFTLAGFVVLVSIIWVVVIVRLQAVDATWNFINVSIWSALEPSMAVICACIPSIRPLFSVAARSLRNVNSSMSRNKLSTNNSKRRTWPNSSRGGNASDGMFSQLEEGSDDTKPLGHNISVRGGHEDGAEGMDIPLRGIQVKTEVVISTEKLEYLDRLF